MSECNTKHRYTYRCLDEQLTKEVVGVRTNRTIVTLVLGMGVFPLHSSPPLGNSDISRNKTKSRIYYFKTANAQTTRINDIVCFTLRQPSGKSSLSRQIDNESQCT